MTPAQMARSAGLPDGLKTVIEVTGVSRATLQNWHKNKPHLFRIVLKGVAAQVKGVEV